MEIELWNGGAKAIIDPIGAWLTNLSDELGDILFPKRLLKSADGDAKQRGGCHVCLPNFGPGGDSGQPQHGYGREKTWEISDKTSDSVLLSLASGEGDFEKMSAELSYQLKENALVMTLETTNNGETNLEVAPAFHPYFSLSPDENSVKVDNKPYELSELAGTEFIDGASHGLETKSRAIVLTSDELKKWALWTDRLGAYVCVEPTESGYAFAENTAKKQLAPGERFLWKCVFEW